MKLRNRIQMGLTGALAALHGAALTREQYAQSARIGAGLGVLAGPLAVHAQGFIRGIQNTNTLFQAGVTVLITLGLLGGLGMVAGGLWNWYKKGEARGGEDITWGKIGMQIAAGGLCMALAWVGSSVVETLGGSTSDIGRAIK